MNHFDMCFESQLDSLKDNKPNFGYNGYGEFCFYRTYSRTKADGGQESWFDVVKRVIDGTFSIRKHHYQVNRLKWNEPAMQKIARFMARDMFDLKWSPPGRGMWAMGTKQVVERGAMALYNCAFTNLSDDHFIDDIDWLMDCLMHGVGVGFDPQPDGVGTDVKDLLLPVRLMDPVTYHYQIPDTREGWVQAVRHQLIACLRPVAINVTFDPSLIREAGSPIVTFGGTSSGSGPLLLLLERIKGRCHQLVSGKISKLQFKTDIGNLIGVCVVAGNVRRSAEIGLTDFDNQEFMYLKDYEKYPDRAGWGYMSNNTMKLIKHQHFESLGEVADEVITRGEPGLVNMRNLKYGRLSDREKMITRYDHAIGLNPCGEIPLEDKEVCNLSVTYPTRCNSIDEWYSQCQHATFYSSTVALLATHRPETNEPVMRNRRIGVDITDYRNWCERIGRNAAIGAMRAGYKRVRAVNASLADEAGVPHSIKVTTIKPGGTVPKLPGVVSGIGSPTFNFTRRRTNVSKVSPIVPLLIEAGLPYESMDDYTYSFSYPIYQVGTPATRVSLWEQAMDLMTVQAHWADNAVSNTLYFKPKWRLIKKEKDETKFGKHLQDCELEEYDTENDLFKVEHKWGELYIYMFDPNHEEDIIESVLSQIISNVKSLSLLPHTPDGVYEFMPESELSESEYNDMVSKIKPIDWSKLKGHDGEDEKYCSGNSCVVPIQEAQ
jgi:ribonucleoside-diphosphate reductase alpha chain